MTTETKERPVLMHARSINGILAGRKTQTRRIIKGMAGLGSVTQAPAAGGEVRGYEVIGRGLDCGAPVMVVKPAWAVPGDRLWVRETLHLDHAEGRGYVFLYAAGGTGYRMWKGKGKLPKRDTVASIHMPRWACRLVLEVVSMRVERVQDIDKAGVIAEGVTERECHPIADVHAGWHEPFAALWNDTNGKGAWERNDWVWVVEFKKVEA